MFPVTSRSTVGSLVGQDRSCEKKRENQDSSVISHQADQYHKQQWALGCMLRLESRTGVYAMSACPSHAHLFRLLNGQLDQDDEAALVAHAETCKGCQERLETLIRGLLAETTTDPSWEKSPSRADRDADEDLTVDRPYATALEITPAAPLDQI